MNLAHPSNEDREATQRFVVLNALVDYCGVKLTSNNAEEIANHLFNEIRYGASAWAFGWCRDDTQDKQ